MTTTTIEKPFFEFTAFCRETEEIRTCTNLKTLYDAVRREMRLYPEEKRTVFFFKNLENWEFDSAVPFFQNVPRGNGVIRSPFFVEFFIQTCYV